MKVSFSAQSHIGNVRTNNEDNLYCGGSILTPETRDTPFTISGSMTAPCLFAVCDGMGGQEDGEFASFATVSTLAELDKTMRDKPSGEIDKRVQEYVTKVNGLLCDKMREKSVRIGTTLALAIVLSDGIRLYNIGDSRIYEFADGKLRQLSIDHTLTAQKVKMGVLTEEQAENDRDRHKLTRYLGIFEDEMIMEAEPLPTLDLTKPLRLLLCSDGLTDLVNNERIMEILKNEPTANAAFRLTDEALASGGKDNITCIVIDIEPGTAAKKPEITNQITKLLSDAARNIRKKLRQIKE